MEAVSIAVMLITYAIIIEIKRK